MGYDVYVDGKYAERLGSTTAWDDAATFIEKNTPANTPLRRLVEYGETHRPLQAAAMLANLLENDKLRPDIAHTLRLLHRLMKGDHVLIYGIGDEP